MGFWDRCCAGGRLHTLVPRGPDLGNVTRAKQGCAEVAMTRPNADPSAPDRGGLRQPWVGYPPHIGGEGGGVSGGLSRQGKHKKTPNHSRSRMVWPKLVFLRAPGSMPAIADRAHSKPRCCTDEGTTYMRQRRGLG